LNTNIALRASCDADWAARPVALTHYNERMALVLEDPAVRRSIDWLEDPWKVSHFLRIAIRLRGRSAKCTSEA